MKLPRVLKPFFVITFLVVPLNSGCESIKQWLVTQFDFEDDKSKPANDSIALNAKGATHATPSIKLKKVGVVNKPTEIVASPNAADSLIILEKDGRAIEMQINSGGISKIFDLKVNSASEMGLLGIAFHPDFVKNRTFYLHYNPAGTQTSKISEWKWPANANPREIRDILSVKQPYANHNGGRILFDHSANLLIGFGDGGWANDPKLNGQNPKTLLGAILRLQVDPQFKEPYRIPTDNPFVNSTSKRPEIFIWGLRNPWKFSLRNDGSLVVADVGQNKLEEISILRSGDNAGWNLKEGNQCFSSTPCPAENLVDPIFEYDHDTGNSITGGEIIRDPRLKSLHNHYIFADFGSGRIMAIHLEQSPQKPVAMLDLGKTALNPATFGLDSHNRVYIGDYSTGAIYRLDPK